MRINEIDLVGKESLNFSQIQKKHSVSYDVLMAELARGIEVEKEHTDNLAVAREIALDHLAEFPDYYTRLSKAEK